MGIAEYFILIGDNETGPWTLGQVQAFWRLGAVSLETLYALPGASEWKPLSAILDVATSTATTPTPQFEKPYEAEHRKMTETVVNVMLPADATRLRQWLREKLDAIGFAPETDGDRESFEAFISFFTDEEQKLAFSSASLSDYRKGKLTPSQLMARQKHALTTDKLLLINAISGKLSDFAIELGRKGAAEANRLTKLRRANNIARQLGLPEKTIDDIPIEETKNKTSKEQPAVENALWTMGIKKPVIDAGTFTVWLGELSGSEQDSIFGTGIMERYRAGKLAAQDLLDELERVATCIATGTGGDLLDLACELFDDEERIASENAPRAIAIIEFTVKKYAGNAVLISEANSMLAEIYASSGKMDKPLTAIDLLKMVFSSPLLMMFAFIELTSGVLRNGVYQWYFIFAGEVKQPGAAFVLKNCASRVTLTCGKASERRNSGPI